MRQLRQYVKSLSQHSQFPHPREADEEGLLCFGGELFPEILLDAYYHGVFPWPHEGLPLLWFSPKQRGVLYFEDLHIAKSLQKVRKKMNYTFTHNKAFKEVLNGCARVPRKGQKGTWITASMKKAYIELHSLGFVRSVECWNGGKLVGGLYGVEVAGVFSGESMFGIEDNVSKLCFIEMVENLKIEQRTWMDIQMVTSVTESMGGKYISQEDYLKLLERTHKIYFERKT